jgi:hypothetical protein
MIGIQPAIPLAAGSSNLNRAPSYRGDLVLHRPPLQTPPTFLNFAAVPCVGASLLAKQNTHFRQQAGSYRDFKSNFNSRLWMFP